MENKRILTIGTEESMVVVTQIAMIKAFFGEDKVFFPVGEKNVKHKSFLYNGEIINILTNIKVEGFNEVIARGVTGTGAFIDYQFYVTEGYCDKLENMVPIAVFEQTKTTERESGNTSGWQRMTKIADFICRFGDKIPMFFIYETREDGVVEVRPSSMAAFAIYSLYNVRVIGKNCNLPSELSKLIEEWHKTDGKDKEFNNKVFLAIANIINSTKEKSNAISYRIFYDENDPLGKSIKIQAKLAKGKNLSISADPGIGFCSGMFLLLMKLGFRGEEVSIVKHGLLEEKVILNNQRKGGKLEGIIKRLPFKVTLSDISTNFELAEVNDKYLISNFKGEKVVSVPFEVWLTGGRPSMVSENGDIVIFSNHAGCGKTFFIIPNGKPIDTKKEKGIPDLIIANNIHKKIYVIEAEKSCNVKRGIEQLSEFTWIKDEYIQRYYPEYKILDGVITYGNLPKEENRKDKRFWLNLDYDGDVYISDSMPEEMKKTILEAIKELKK